MALSQSSSYNKTKHCLVALIRGTQGGQLMETESGEVTAGAREGGLKGQFQLVK